MQIRKGRKKMKKFLVLMLITGVCLSTLATPVFADGAPCSEGGYGNSGGCDTGIVQYVTNLGRVSLYPDLDQPVYDLKANV